MEFTVPTRAPSKRKEKAKRRRSSIMKPQRPLEEIQNVSMVDERVCKYRRVSFANTIEINEFHTEKPTGQLQHDVGSKGLSINFESATGGDNDTVVQMSTPKKKKRRRISADTSNKIERLSFIPKPPTSPVEEFEVFEDNAAFASTAARHEITLAESPKKACLDTPVGTVGTDFDTFKEFSTVDDPKSPLCGLPSQNSDMELTLVDMSFTCMESGTSNWKQEGNTVVAPVNESVEKETFSNPTSVPAEVPQQQLPTVLEKSNNCTMCEPSQVAANKSEVNMSLEFPESLLMSSLKKKRGTPSHVLVPSSTSAVASYPMLPTSRVPLEAQLRQSKLVRGANVIAVKPCFQWDPVETTTDDVVEMDLEESLNRNASLRNTTTLVAVTLPNSSTTSSPSHQSLHKSVPIPQSSSAPKTEETKDDDVWLCALDSKGSLTGESCLEVLPDEQVEESGESLPLVEGTPVTVKIPDRSSFPLPPSYQENQVANMSAVHAAIKCIRSSVKEKYDILDVNSPTPVPEQQPRYPILHSSTLAHVTLNQTNIEESQMNESYANRQSLLMSPSGFSKFLAKLNCDKTIVEDAAPTERVSLTALSPSTTFDASMQESSTSDSQLHCNNDSQSTTPPVEALFPRSNHEHSYCSEDEDMGKHSDCDATAPVNTPSSSVEATPSSAVEAMGPQPAGNVVKVSFADSLLIVKHRLTEMVTGLKTRLSNLEYLKTHEAVKPCIEALLRAACNGLRVISLLLRYGELSGKSSTYQWDWKRVCGCLPSPFLSQDDITGTSTMKAEWIQATHQELLLRFYPVVSALMEEAASLYPWQLEGLYNNQLEMTCGTYKLALQLQEQSNEVLGSSTIVESVDMQPEDGNISDMLLQSHNIASIAEIIWSLNNTV